MLSLIGRRAARQSDLFSSYTNPVAQSISISPDDDTVSISTDDSVTITYTLTRNGGYTGTVTPSVTGLPTGVSGAWSDTSLTGGDTTTILTLTSVSAPDVTNDAFTVTFSGSGVSDAVDNGTVTVYTVGAFTPNLPGGVGLVERLDTVFTAAQTPSLGTGGGTSGWEWSPTTGASHGELVTGRSVSAWGSTALRTIYPGNDLGGGVGGVLIEKSSAVGNWNKMYFAMAMDFQSDYSMHSNGEKWLYMFVTSPNSPSNVACIVNLHCGHNGTTPNGSNFYIDMVPNLVYTSTGPFGGAAVQYSNHANFGGTYYPIFPDITTNMMTKGQEDVVECYFAMNTIDTADGVFKCWVNGVLVCHRTNVQYILDGSQGRFSDIRFDGTRGGGNSSTATPAGGQSRYFSRLACWTV